MNPLHPSRFNLFLPLFGGPSVFPAPFLRFTVNPFHNFGLQGKNPYFPTRECALSFEPINVAHDLTTSFGGGNSFQISGKTSHNPTLVIMMSKNRLNSFQFIRIHSRFVLRLFSTDLMMTGPVGGSVTFVHSSSHSDLNSRCASRLHTRRQAL